MSKENNSSKRVFVSVAAIVIVLAVLLSVYLLYFKSSSIEAKTGDNVSVFYTLTYTNGTVIQSNFNQTPFSFVIGSNTTITGFNNAVMGMKVNQTKNVTLPPSEAYGNPQPSLIVTIPRSDLGNSTLADGEAVSSDSGQTGVITTFNSTNVTVNFNSPLAGKTLVFYIKLVKINS